MISSEQIEDAEFEVIELKKKYLRQNGWEYSSNYDGSFWLWENKEKGLKGCSTSTAISIQSA